MNLFSKTEERDFKNIDTSSTFLDNLSLPVHRWFRYSAGFSATWVQKLIQEKLADGRTRILDPFAGSATVLLESEYCNTSAIGLEAHPFIARVARAKLYWRESPQHFKDYALSILAQARQYQSNPPAYPRLIERCFPSEILSRLHSLRRVWQASADASPISELTWLTLVSILRECSPVGTAQWQYVLPNKTKMNANDPYEAFQLRLNLIFEDMKLRHRLTPGPKAALYNEDARACSSIPDGWADLVITSPPYANNYDYADATRLEMCFFGEIQSWGDLQESVRKYLVRSCTQHITTLNGETDSILADALLDPIRKEITYTCKKLESKRQEHGGKKPYHTMIAAYFHDMARIWIALRRVTAKGSLVCFVIGDSAPYGIYVPVDTWLGKLALAAGFKSNNFEKTRDRNTKWKNRKHRVPLHEGRLWITG